MSTESPDDLARYAAYLCTLPANEVIGVLGEIKHHRFDMQMEILSAQSMIEDAISEAAGLIIESGTWRNAA